MRKNRLLMSVLFALSSGAVACGGADDSSLDNSAESLKRSVDGGQVHIADRSSDTDESADEAAHDGGKRHQEHADVHGDGGTCHHMGIAGGGHHGKGGPKGDKDDGPGKGGPVGAPGHEASDGGAHGPGAPGAPAHEGHDGGAGNHLVPPPAHGDGGLHGK